MTTNADTSTNAEFRTYWLPKARRLHQKYPHSFPVPYNETSNPEEVRTSVEVFEIERRLSQQLTEKQQIYTTILNSLNQFGDLS